MPSRLRCYLLTPTSSASVILRRCGSFESGKTHPCTREAPRYPGAEIIRLEYHEAEVTIGREIATFPEDTDGHAIHGELATTEIPKSDPRWPTHCACGYAFVDGDLWQVNRDRLFQRSDTGELTTRSDAPAGALYDCRNGPDDAPRIMCKTPAGEWLLDHPIKGWSWTGILPDITVTPSIAIGEPRRFHAVLTNGWLEIDQP